MRGARCFLSAVLLLTACASVDSVRKEHGDAARKTLTAVDAVAADLRGRSEIAPAAYGYEKGELAKVALDFGWRAAGGNAAIVYEEDIQKHGELGAVYGRIDGTKEVAHCGAMLEHSTWAWDPLDPAAWNASIAGFEVERNLVRCGALKYLFVIRTLALGTTDTAHVLNLLSPTPPPSIPNLDAGARGLDAGTRADVAPDASAALATAESATLATCGSLGRQCVFVPAYTKAELHLYALSPVAHLGALPLVAESADTVRYHSTVGSSIELDFKNQVAALVRSVLQTSAPGVVVKGAP